MADGSAEALAEHLELARRMEQLLPQVDAAAEAIVHAYEGDHRVVTFGNGGSAADSMHFAEELVARFKRERRPLAAQSLAADSTALTCIANDYEYDEIFARQVRAFVRTGDVAIGFTTSGRSESVVRALAAAREQGAVTILFGGGEGQPAATHADHALVVPSSSTARVQEMHVLMLHLMLEQVDAWAAQ
ncbi:MAG: sugar isomerase [Gemmatimonadetes bacterium]|nr:sugar isomerase [Gemmatimonadota bacterium]